VGDVIRQPLRPRRLRFQRHRFAAAPPPHSAVAPPPTLPPHRPPPHRPHAPAAPPAVALFALPAVALRLARSPMPSAPLRLVRRHLVPRPRPTSPPAVRLAPLRSAIAHLASSLLATLGALTSSSAALSCLARRACVPPRTSARSSLRRPLPSSLPAPSSSLTRQLSCHPSAPLRGCSTPRFARPPLDSARSDLVAISTSFRSLALVEAPLPLYTFRKSSSDTCTKCSTSMHRARRQVTGAGPGGVRPPRYVQPFPARYHMTNSMRRGRSGLCSRCGGRPCGECLANMVGFVRGIERVTAVARVSSKSELEPPPSRGCFDV